MIQHPWSLILKCHRDDFDALTDNLGNAMAGLL